MTNESPITCVRTVDSVVLVPVDRLLYGINRVNTLVIQVVNTSVKKNSNSQLKNFQQSSFAALIAANE